ncbi:hypothetical protein [Geodermatophilus sp. URMC 63]
MNSSTSVLQTPTRSTSTTTSPGTAVGAGTSSTAHRPGPESTTARIVLDTAPGWRA